jgi:hypothetical protein
MSEEQQGTKTSVEELPRLSLRGMRVRWKLRGARNRSLGAARVGDGDTSQVGFNHVRGKDGTWFHGSGGSSGGGGM